ncbi:hypothetical protein BDY17DRAFT_109876 [Neohortaea acidophila]|uniref:Uncharacterized protein n=1 Tax=Neohortaea acidophila TaxID=245834 RepID=A0A6A6Q1X3_9PEZI|nr:uncharacterized protein BDY17DRAFT_109876 [Neohortaea acidophila]KAF2485673.1 hypothetical protein BDY17DRAFT_109876 [Neohortaea acidophila]
MLHVAHSFSLLHFSSSTGSTRRPCPSAPSSLFPFTLQRTLRTLRLASSFLLLPSDCCVPTLLQLLTLTLNDDVLRQLTVGQDFGANARRLCFLALRMLFRRADQLACFLYVVFAHARSSTEFRSVRRITRVLLGILPLLPLLVTLNSLLVARLDRLPTLRFANAVGSADFFLLLRISFTLLLIPLHLLLWFAPLLVPLSLPLRLTLDFLFVPSFDCLLTSFVASMLPLQVCRLVRALMQDRAPVGRLQSSQGLIIELSPALVPGALWFSRFLRGGSHRVLQLSSKLCLGIVR